MNAAHVKNVPGRKTDKADARWLATLMRYGLLQASFIPPEGQRDLRDLTRYRTKLVQKRAREVNRVQGGLERANSKRASVVSDIMGDSGRAMIEALSAAIQTWLGTLSTTEVSPSPAPGLPEDQRQQAADVPQPLTFTQAVELLDTILGVDQRGAAMLVAEIGRDMTRFGTAPRLAAWAGVAPGNDESAGKQRSGRTRQGNQTLRAGFTQLAHAAVHTKETYLAAFYRRLAARRGKKRAIRAVAHSSMVSAFYMRARNEPSRELGANYFDERRRHSTVGRLASRLERLGYRVHLEPVAATAA